MTNLAVSVGTKLRAVTPSDSTVVGCQALYVGTTGDVYITAEGDTASVTLVGVPAGTYIPIACLKVGASTTATNIVAIFV